MNAFLRRLCGISSADASRNMMIDFWRGSAMLCVMLQHGMSMPGNLYDFLLAFHMPAFFLISGFMLSFANPVPRYTVKEYFAKRFQQLMIPYFLFELVFLPLFAVYYWETGDICQTIWSIFMGMNMESAMGKRLWFFPCLLIADVAVFIVLKKFRSKVLLLLLAGLCAFISWCLTSNGVGRLPYTLDISFMAMVFIILGYIGASLFVYIRDKSKYRKWSFLAVSALLGGGCYVCSLYNDDFLMFANSYGHYGLAIVAALLGCGFLFLASSAVYEIVPCSRNIMSWLGRNSLSLFPLHLMVLKVLTAIGPFFDMSAFVKFILMFVACIPLANFIALYLPFMAGKGLKRKKYV